MSENTSHISKTSISAATVDDMHHIATDQKVIPNTLIIACGALSREIIALTKLNNWQHIKVQCLPADLHNRPQLIPEKVEAMLVKTQDKYSHIFIAYADCGTGGMLDAVCQKYGVERMPGTHCYGFFSGLENFEQMMEEELGTYFLTDFMVRHFDRIIWEGMGLKKNPELLEMYFAHYKRVIYLAQTSDESLLNKARTQAERLGLAFEVRETGYGLLETSLAEQPIRFSLQPSVNNRN
jgi:hypothetical protein